MVGMAIIGLIFAWWTTAYRRQRDHLEQTAVNQEPDRVLPVAPAKLAALGYLPADSNVIVGLHVAELLSNPATQQLFLAARPEAGWDIHSLEQWTGIELSDMDHAVLGLNVEDRLIPRLVLVVQTLRPYDPDKIRAALRSERRTERGQRTLYRFNLKQSGLEALVWFADERTLVLALVPEDLDKAPRTAVSGVERFSADLQKLLVPMHEGTQVWLVGHAGDWARVFNPQPLPGMPGVSLWQLPRKDQEVLAGLRTFGLWLEVNEEVGWHLAVEGADPAAAGRLQQYLSQIGLKAGEAFKIFGKRPATERLARELAETLAQHQTDNWVTYQARSSALAIRQAMSP
jgi:hypothetical protein